MTRRLFIILGAFLMALVLGLWIYLIFFGAPKDTNDVFADLGFSEREEQVVREQAPVAAFEPIRNTHINIGVSELTQLTLRPVAGYAFVETGEGTSTRTFIRYAERGVGHVYDIDLETGLEERVLGKTFTAVREAVFAPNGGAVVLIAEGENDHVTYLEEINAPEAMDHSLPSGATNIAFVTSSDLRYTLQDEAGTRGYSYNLDEIVSSELFNVAFRDVAVVWEHGETYLFNRPTPLLTGSLYRIKNGILTLIAGPGYAFSTLIDPNNYRYLITEYDTSLEKLSSVLIENTNEMSSVPIVALRNKCAFSPNNSNEAWCGAPSDKVSRSFETDWYKGVMHSPDFLWRIDFEEQRAEVALDFELEIARPMDIEGLIMDPATEMLMFTNKIDGALWLYDTAFETRFDMEENIEPEAADSANTEVPAL